MMTLRRFRTLAGSYGADLQRWPEPLRRQARALLETSAQAQALMAQARELDQTIAAAGAARDARIWDGSRADAALHRLRADVSNRVRRPAAGRAPGLAEIDSRAARHPHRRARWVRLATAAGLAVVAGLALGILYSPSAPPQDLTALLQPAPLQLLTD